jgi:hypothetical protein
MLSHYYAMGCDFLWGQENIRLTAGKLHKKLPVFFLHQLVQHFYLIRIEAVLSDHVRMGFGGYIYMQDDFGGGDGFRGFIAVLVSGGYGCPPWTPPRN